MSAAPDPASSAPGAPTATGADKGPRYLVLFALTLLGAALLGLVASVAFAALVSFLPPIAGLLVGVLFAFALPIFLAVRATRALKRRGRGVLLRRLVTAFLLFSTQLAVLGAVLQFSSRGSGHLAATGAGVLHTFGDVPVLSGLLEEHARREQVPLPYDDKKPAVGPDGGSVGADGGVADAGVATPDAGAAAGGAAAPAAPALSPRTSGGAHARTVALAATLASGAPALAVVQLAFGGTATVRVVELGAFAKHGAVTALAAAEDGHVAAVLGGTHVVTSKPGRAAELVKALSRDAQLAQKEGKATFTYDVQGVRDVAIGPGGDVLVVADVLDATDTSGALTPALLHLAKGQGAATLLRRGGQTVPGASESAVLGFDIKPARGDGRVVLVETFREGADAVTPNVQGEQFTLNPERVLTMRLDQPKVLQEVARSEAAASGIPDRTLQAFADAVALHDGRVVFDANFAEEGPAGWLFVWRAGGAPAQALAPELFATRAASFGARAPRAKLLDIEPDGALVFVRDDALVRSSIGAAREALVGLKGAKAVERKPAPPAPAGAPAAAPLESARGVIARVTAPFVAQGGQWVLALAHVEGVGDALVLASVADLKAGVAELVLASGDKRDTAPGTSVTLQALKLPVQDELLWTPAPSDGAAPAPHAADAGAP